VACDSSCACARRTRLSDHALYRDHHWSGLLLGTTARGNHDEREKALEKLAKDDAFWLRCGDGINHVRLEYDVPSQR